MWVIDDDSMYSDEYQEIITHFNHHFTIQYIKMEKNSGPGPCRNVIIRQGTAPWITFIDDDDIVINNPLDNFPKNIANVDLIKSTVCNETGKECAKLDSFWTGCWGTIFNRNYLLTHNFLFFEDLGVVGTEDSVFLLFTVICADNIFTIDSFILHKERDKSQYHLNSSSCVMHYGMSGIFLCNIYNALLLYHHYIKNYAILWKAIKKQYKVIKNTPMPTDKNILYLYDYYKILFSLVFFKLIKQAFPDSNDIKNLLTEEDEEFFPLLYSAYHFCTIDENDILYYTYKKQPFLNAQNFIPQLSHEDMVYSLHFTSMYYGLIKYVGLKLIKDNRRKKGLPEKYWNF